MKDDYGNTEAKPDNVMDIGKQTNIDEIIVVDEVVGLLVVE